MDRRKFAGAAITLPFALRSLARAAAPVPRWVFLGTDRGKGIYRARWNASTGELSNIELAAATDRPDFFAMHPELPVMYTVNSVGEGKGAVSSYKVDAAAGELTLLNRVSSHGDGPCAVSICVLRAFVANYTGGSFAAYAVAADGALADHGWVLDCHASGAACGTGGPVKDRQDAAHLHCVTIAPGGHIVVCDLGNDSIAVFAMPKEHLGTPLRYSTRKGSGPRHVAFHPNGKWMYCIHELDCTIDLYDWNVRGGKDVLTFREDSIVRTLARGTDLAGNTACEVLVSNDGRFVYACTRGVDEITVYQVDKKTGLLTEVQRLSCRGQVPRYMTFDPSRKWLVVCNQGSAKDPVGSVTVFAREATTGKLNATPKSFPANTPMFAQFV